MSRKYKECTDNKLLLTGPQGMRIVRCILDKRHEGEHTDGEEVWPNVDRSSGPR